MPYVAIQSSAEGGIQVTVGDKFTNLNVCVISVVRNNPFMNIAQLSSQNEADQLKGTIFLMVTTVTINTVTLTAFKMHQCYMLYMFNFQFNASVL